MPMTTQNFGNQNQPPADPDCQYQVKDTPGANVKAAPATSKDVTSNAGGTSATPGTVVKPAVMDGGKPRGSATVPSNDPYKL